MRTSIQAPMRKRRHGRSAAGLLSRSVMVSCVLLGCGSTWAYSLPFLHRDAAQQHREIEGLEQDWRQAMLSSNVNEMNTLLADDYLGVTPNGTLETKADIMALRRSGSVHISQMNLSDLKVRVYGDTAVVTSRAALTGTNNGTDISGEYRYTRVYNRRNGQWRIVSFEASRVPEDALHHHHQ